MSREIHGGFKSRRSCQIRGGSEFQAQGVDSLEVSTDTSISWNYRSTVDVNQKPRGKVVYQLDLSTENMYTRTKFQIASPKTTYRPAYQDLNCDEKTICTIEPISMRREKHTRLTRPLEDGDGVAVGAETDQTSNGSRQPTPQLEGGQCTSLSTPRKKPAPNRPYHTPPTMFSSTTRSLIGASKHLRVCKDIAVPLESINSCRLTPLQFPIPIRSLSTPSQPNAPPSTEKTTAAPQTKAEPTPTSIPTSAA